MQFDWPGNSNSARNGDSGNPRSRRTFGQRAVEPYLSDANLARDKGLISAVKHNVKQRECAVQTRCPTRCDLAVMMTQPVYATRDTVQTCRLRADADAVHRRHIDLGDSQSRSEIFGETISYAERVDRFVTLVSTVSARLRSVFSGAFQTPFLLAWCGKIRQPEGRHADPIGHA